MNKFARCEVCLCLVDVTWRGKLQYHPSKRDPDQTCAGSGTKAKVYGKITSTIESFTDRALVDELKKRGYTVFKSSFPELEVKVR